MPEDYTAPNINCKSSSGEVSAWNGAISLLLDTEGKWPVKCFFFCLIFNLKFSLFRRFPGVFICGRQAQWLFDTFQQKPQQKKTLKKLFFRKPRDWARERHELISVC